MRRQEATLWEIRPRPYFEQPGYALVAEILSRKLDDKTLRNVLRGLDEYYAAQTVDEPEGESIPWAV